MRKYDIVACVAIIILGLGWFAAAEVVYDGSLMEDPCSFASRGIKNGGVVLYESE